MFTEFDNNRFLLSIRNWTIPLPHRLSRFSRDVTGKKVRGSPMHVELFHLVLDWVPPKSGAWDKDFWECGWRGWEEWNREGGNAKIKCVIKLVPSWATGVLSYWGHSEEPCKKYFRIVPTRERRWEKLSICSHYPLVKGYLWGPTLLILLSIYGCVRMTEQIPAGVPGDGSRDAPGQKAIDKWCNWGEVRSGYTWAQLVAIATPRVERWAKRMWGGGTHLIIIFIGPLWFLLT